MKWSGVRRAAIAAALIPWVLAAPRVAHAQVADQAIRACLLLRTPAQCGVGWADPFLSPGDLQTLRVLRPDPMLDETRKEAPAQPDRFTPVRGAVGAETTLEKNRQVIGVPLDWSPFRALSLSADVPLVAQALASTREYSIGDIAFSATGRGRLGPVSLRGLGIAKLPTGDPARGAGTGAFDAMALVDAWFTYKIVAGTLSGAYRFDGAQKESLVQESAAVSVDVPIWALFGAVLEGRVFGHEMFGATSGQTVHAAIGVQPKVLGYAAGYVCVLLPVVEPKTLPTGIVVSGGVNIPFGRSKASPASAPPPPKGDDPKPDAPAATPNAAPPAAPNAAPGEKPADPAAAPPGPP
jgi:hypothetical protein